MGLEYQCAMCGGTFESDRPDEEAIAEKDLLFGAIPMEQCDIICEDCFQSINPVTVEVVR